MNEQDLLEQPKTKRSTKLVLIVLAIVVLLIIVLSVSKRSKRNDDNFVNETDSIVSSLEEGHASADQMMHYDLFGEIQAFMDKQAKYVMNI